MTSTPNTRCSHDEQGFSLHGRCLDCGAQVHYSAVLERRAYERRMAGGGAGKPVRKEES